jgi:hypothetical protein
MVNLPGAGHTCFHCSRGYLFGTSMCNELLLEVLSFLCFILSTQAGRIRKVPYLHFTDEETEAQKGDSPRYWPVSELQVPGPAPHSHIHSACSSPRQPSFTKPTLRCSLFASCPLLSRAPHSVTFSKSLPFSEFQLPH